MQLRGPTPPTPPTKNHDYSIILILSCPQEKRNKTRKNKNRLAHRPISKKHMHTTPPITPLPSSTLSFTKIFISAKHKRQDRTG